MAASLLPPDGASLIISLLCNQAMIQTESGSSSSRKQYSATALGRDVLWLSYPSCHALRPRLFQR